MTSFGAKRSSTVNAEDKSLRPGSKETAADEARKPANQAGTAQGLPTPESTPGPDTARLEADKARREAETAKASNARTPDSSSTAGAAVVATNNDTDSAQSSQLVTSTNDSPDGASDEGQRNYTDEQKNAVDRVLKCAPNRYYQILGVKDPSTKKKIKKAYKGHSRLLHPDKNKYKDAAEAFKLVNKAAKILGVESEDFAENAYEEEDGASGGNDEMDTNQSEAPKPDDFRKKIYEEATPHLANLMKDLKDAGAKLKLEKLNKRIKEQNIRDKLPKEDLDNFLIPISTFTASFEMANNYCKALKQDPNDNIARQQLTRINNMLGQLNERHGYPDDWLIHIPEQSDSHGAESSEAADSRDASQAGQTSTKGGMKTKVGVPISDESDGRTSLGKVVNVRKAGFGSRVIVNRGTDQNPYFDIYPGAEFGKEVAKDWLEEGRYRCEDLPKDTEAKKLEIYGRVKVKKTTRKDDNKAIRTRSEIQYYLIKVENQDYISTRSALSGTKRLSSTKLKRIDAQLNRQNEQLLLELDSCRERNEHPDTGEQLTEADIADMPWLSPDTIRQIDEKDEEDDDDESIGNIVPQRTGLKRNTKPKAATRTPKRDSVESQL